MLRTIKVKVATTSLSVGTRSFRSVAAASIKQGEGLFKSNNGKNNDNKRKGFWKKEDRPSFRNRNSVKKGHNQRAKAGGNENDKDAKDRADISKLLGILGDNLGTLNSMNRSRLNRNEKEKESVDVSVKNLIAGASGGRSDSSSLSVNLKKVETVSFDNLGKNEVKIFSAAGEGQSSTMSCDQYENSLEQDFDKLDQFALTYADVAILERSEYLSMDNVLDNTSLLKNLCADPTEVKKAEIPQKWSKSDLRNTNLYNQRQVLDYAYLDDPNDPRACMEHYTRAKDSELMHENDVFISNLYSPEYANEKYPFLREEEMFQDPLEDHIKFDHIFAKFDWDAEWKGRVAVEFSKALSKNPYYAGFEKQEMVEGFCKTIVDIKREPVPWRRSRLKFTKSTVTKMMITTKSNST